MKWQILKDWNKVSGSSLCGEIKINYQDLVKVFGKPSSEGDAYKVDAEWELEFEDGTIATIYNWKNGQNYCGKNGTPVKYITNWHIGGMSRNSVKCVLDALGRNQLEFIYG